MLFSSGVGTPSFNFGANLPKKVYRLYREENLLVRTKRRRKLAARLRVVPPTPVRVNERWGMDFLSDQLSNGQRFESFNGKLRDECLNLHWFATLEEAQKTLNDWRQDYNKTRPHSSLGNLAPADYVARLIQVPAEEGQPKPAIFSF